MTELRCPRCGRVVSPSAEGETASSCPECEPQGAGVAPADSSAPTRQVRSDAVVVANTVLDGVPTGGAEPTPAPPSVSSAPSDVAVEIERAWADPKKRFGSFLVLSELGKGGMGVVYRAWDSRLRRVVALKTILPGADVDNETIQRFRREAEAVARLRHPNIVAVHEAGETDGKHYIAMDFVAGSTLQRRLGPAAERAERLPLSRSVEVMRDVARAVHYAHEQGVVHRDIKPANILLDGKTHPFVLDFGLASIRGSGTKLTRTGASMGTPAYMPPEQARGQRTDERSDVYSLGATLYYVLTGRAPFDGASDMNIFMAVMTKDPAPPTTFNRRLSADLETICLKCLEKEPEKRYASAAALADDLGSYLAGDPIAARPLSAMERVVRRARRNKLATALVGLSILLVVSPLVAALVVHRTRIKAEEERKRAIEAEHEAALVAERERHKRAAREEARTTSEAFAAALAARPGEGLEAEQQRTDDLLARGLRALQAGLRLTAIASDDVEARKRAFATALELGRVALKAEQWSVASTAFEEAAGLSVDDALAAQELKRVSAQRRALQDEHKATVESTIAAVLSSSRAYDHDDALFTLVRLGEPQTVRLLVAQLDESSRLLGEATRAVYLSAADPGELEATAGEPRLVGIDAAVDKLLALKVGESRDASSAELLDRAERRVVARMEKAGRRLRFGQILASAQAAKLGSRRLELTKLTCIALGRIRIEERALESLVSYLAAEEDELRAIPAGVALAHLGSDHAVRAVRACRWFSTDGPFRMQVTSVLERRRLAPVQRAATAQEFFERGRARMDTGDLDHALEDFTQAIELARSDFRAWFFRGIAKHKKRDLSGAVKDLSEAIDRDPRQASIWTDRALVRSDLGDLEGAIADFTQAITLAPESVVAWNERGHTRAQRGDHAGALADFERAIELDPRRASIWSDLGETLLASGKADLAIEKLSRAIELDARSAEAFRLRGNARSTKGDSIGAIADLSRAIELSPRWGLAWRSRAGARARGDDLEGALDDLNHAIELMPKSADALADRAELRVMRGDDVHAIADATAALEASPKLARALQSRGVARSRKGDSEGAIADLTGAIELSPGSAECWNHRGFAREKVGDLAGAASDFRRFLELAPGSPEAASVRRALERLTKE